ncbi:Hypothetical predicted protein [Octopus vulgaris]|uniref:Uncharacterized protein n=1 Tax=Octopus vulgaris TaxID=6645 RepID=A0AA36B0T6_OCTVU|nr:Hypothetical predicted protein [Octopus vulgaris]
MHNVDSYTYLALDQEIPLYQIQNWYTWMTYSHNQSQQTNKEIFGWQGFQNLYETQWDMRSPNSVEICSKIRPVAFRQKYLH